MNWRISSIERPWAINSSFVGMSMP